METNKQANLVLIRQLKDYGVQLDKPRRLDHNFLAGSEDEVMALGAKLAENGFDCELGEYESDSDDNGQWGLIASIDQSPEDACADDFLRKIITWALERGCDYDGWGTELDCQPLDALEEDARAAFERLKNNPAFDAESLKRLEDL